MPVLQSLLILGHDLLVLFELVTHLDLDTTRLVQLCSLLVEFGLECLELVLFQFEGLDEHD